MLSNVTGVQTDAYFKRRHEHAFTNPRHAVTLSMEGTSISTYSSTIMDAAWGHAKQNPELKQANYMPVVDHETRDVVFATSDDGSINDKAVLPTIYERMRNAGLSLENNILVTDRGFNSMYNTPQTPGNFQNSSIKIRLWPDFLWYMCYNMYTLHKRFLLQRNVTYRRR